MICTNDDLNIYEEILTYLHQFFLLDKRKVRLLQGILVFIVASNSQHIGTVNVSSCSEREQNKIT